MRGKILSTSYILLTFIPSTVWAESWVETSNKYTNQQIEIVSQFQPEFASFMGITEADARCSNISEAENKKYISALKKSKIALQNALAKEKLTPVLQDINILINNIDQTITTDRLETQYMLSWVDCSAQLNQDTFLKELCSYSTGDRSPLAV